MSLFGCREGVDHTCTCAVPSAPRQALDSDLEHSDVDDDEEHDEDGDFDGDLGLGDVEDIEEFGQEASQDVDLADPYMHSSKDNIVSRHIKSLRANIKSQLTQRSMRESSDDDLLATPAYRKTLAHLSRAARYRSSPSQAVKWHV